MIIASQAMEKFQTHLGVHAGVARDLAHRIDEVKAYISDARHGGGGGGAHLSSGGGASASGSAPPTPKGAGSPGARWGA